MKIATYYLILFLIVFIATIAVSPVVDQGTAPEQNKVEQTPWQQYDGLLWV